MKGGAEETEGGVPAPLAGASLCASCRHVRVVCSSRGSTFFLCKLAASDARFPKYPPQPVVACSGWER